MTGVVKFENVNPTMNDPTEAQSGAPEFPLPRKLGANHSETTTRKRKRHPNFRQSTDLREDRGIRQSKTNPKRKA